MLLENFYQKSMHQVSILIKEDFFCFMTMHNNNFPVKLSILKKMNMYLFIYTFIYKLLPIRVTKVDCFYTGRPSWHHF